MDNGDNFDPVFNLSDNSGNSTVPEISVAGRDVYIVWQDTSQGNNDIFFRRSIDGGASFEPTQNISNNTGTSRDHDISVS